jgi:LPS O-antigen subunit length determinant protein (WzzB/FepE family)
MCVNAVAQEKVQEQTQEITDTQQNQEFSFIEFIVLSWRLKWWIGAFTSVFAIVAILIVLFIPNQYKSAVLLAPSDEQKGGGLAALANQFGSLASLAGINLAGKGGDKTMLALEVFRSKQFIMGFIERHDILIPLMAGKEWDHKTGELELDDSDYDVENKKWVRKVAYPKQVKPSLQEAYKAFRDRLSFDRDNKSGTVIVAFEFYSPVLAQQWLTLLVKDLNAYMRDKEHRESARSIEYLNKQIANTQVAELRKVFFQLVQEQTKNAMLAEAREEFVFKTIDVAVVPEIKSKPFRAIIVIIITLFGGVLSLFSVHVFQAIRQKRKQQ